jgi:hypothetical protein
MFKINDIVVCTCCTVIQYVKYPISVGGIYKVISVNLNGLIELEGYPSEAGKGWNPYWFTLSLIKFYTDIDSVNLNVILKKMTEEFQ